MAGTNLPLYCVIFWFQDLLSHVEKIAEFLKIPSNPDLFKAIAEKCTFSKMNEEKQTNIPPAVDRCTRVEGLNYLYTKGKSLIGRDWSGSGEGIYSSKYILKYLICDFNR